MSHNLLHLIENEKNLTIPINEKENILANQSLKSLSKHKNMQKPLFIENALSLNPIHFGKVLPGQIKEQDLIITNLTNFSMMIAIQVTCMNKEYESLDEYVFSIKKSANDYNDFHVLPLKSRATVTIRLALKVPQDRHEKSINGQVQVLAQTPLIQGIFKHPISSTLIKPHLTCQKLLYSKFLEYDVISLALKCEKKIEIKIPFKNLTEIPIRLDSGFLHDWQEDFPFEASVVVPKELIQPNSQFFVTFVLKIKHDFVPRVYNTKQVLILKPKNSSVFFGFPLLIRIF